MPDLSLLRRTGAPARAAAAAAGALLLAGPAAALAQSAPAPPPRGGDAIVQWSRVTLRVLRTPGAQPAGVHPTRTLALVHVAQYDAVEAVDRRYAQYGTRLSAPRRTSAVAAAGVAAHDVLCALYPAQKPALDRDEAATLTHVPGGVRKRRGIALGARAARAVLKLRANDGAAATPPAYTTTGAPGDFAPTPPAFAAPAFTGWGLVHPWVLRSAAQERPAAPPALGSREYATAYDEVHALGSASSTSRTADQTQQARFWAAPIQNYWNEIAQSAAIERHASLERDARAFAQLGLAVADGTIAFYDAKYHYRAWRPIAAIRGGDTDANPATAADPGWTPLATTPADPSYPGAHSVVSAAAAVVLGAAYGRHTAVRVFSEALPDVSRGFPSFAATATEAGLSRIYAGVHTRPDHVAGTGLGRAVARYVLGHALRPRPVARG